MSSSVASLWDRLRFWGGIGVGALLVAVFFAVLLTGRGFARVVGGSS